MLPAVRSSSKGGRVMAGGVLKLGQKVTVPGLPGTWSVWSQAGGYGPGAYFVIPADGGGIAGSGYRVIRAKQEYGKAWPTITLLDPMSGGA